VYPHGSIFDLLIGALDQQGDGIRQLRLGKRAANLVA
jgi:hypothetical protein